MPTALKTAYQKKNSTRKRTYPMRKLDKLDVSTPRSSKFLYPTLGSWKKTILYLTFDGTDKSCATFATTLTNAPNMGADMTIIKA